MGKLILKNCVTTINGVDFSDHVSQVEVSLKKAAVDTTNFSGGGKEQRHGLKEDEFTMTLQQNFSASMVDATLYPLFDLETEFTVTVKPTNAAVSASNPLFSATCILLEYMPLTGSPGKLSEVKIKFPAQRSGISRATS